MKEQKFLHKNLPFGKTINVKNVQKKSLNSTRHGWLTCHIPNILGAIWQNCWVTEHSHETALTEGQILLVYTLP